MAQEELKEGSVNLRRIVNARGTAIDGVASRMKYLGFTGRNGAGAITVTGAAVGDTVVGVCNTTDGGSGASAFETTVTVANQIQQSSASDLSTKKYTVVLVTAAP